jgi:phosphatidylinositol-3-phosphatase
VCDRTATKEGFQPVRRFLIAACLVVAGVLAAVTGATAHSASVSTHPRHARPSLQGRRHPARAHHRGRRRHRHPTRAHHPGRHRHRHRHRRHVHHRKHKHPVHRKKHRPPALAPTPPAVPTANKIQHVVWILMENKDVGSVIGSRSAPFINSLANTFGLATGYSAISHPSLPNYIALTSGSDQGIADDSNPSSHPLNVPSIFSQLPDGTSRSLAQDMPSNCAMDDSGEYAVRHNPETYYTNLGSECSSYDVPFGATPDLSARFTLVTPNLINDMHDGTIADGDMFLQGYLPELMATPEYQAGNTVIFITWDENEGASGNQVPCIVVSPYTHGVKDPTPYTHYSLLRTTEELLGLPLLGDAASATSMRGKFGF